MSAVFDPKDPRYDQSGKHPIDEHGWQIVDLGKSLSIGDPPTYKVITPTIKYYFGMSTKQDPDYKENYRYRIGVITSFGFKNPAFVGNDDKPFDNSIVFKSDQERAHHEQRIREILIKNQNDSRYSDYPSYGFHFTGVEFSSGSGMLIEVF